MTAADILIACIVAYVVIGIAMMGYWERAHDSAAGFVLGCLWPFAMIFKLGRTLRKITEFFW